MHLKNTKIRDEVQKIGFWRLFQDQHDFKIILQYARVMVGLIYIRFT